MNHLCNLSELLPKLNAARRRNGKAGSIGKTTPTAPIPSPINPSMIHKSLLIFIFFLQSFLFLFTLYDVANCHYGMMEYHPRSWKSHNLTDFFTHFRLVTMHTAVRAKGLGFHKGAFITALHRILRKCFAFGTKIFLCPMLLSTIKSYHQSDGTLFPFSLALNFIYHNFSPFSFSKSLSDKQKIKCILQFSHKVPLNIPAFCRLLLYRLCQQSPS